jgi:hypothetical protein
MDAARYQNLVSTVQGLIYERAVLAQELGAVNDGGRDSHQVTLGLASPRTQMSLWYDPSERPRRWHLKAESWPQWYTPWSVAMPWDARYSGYVTNHRREVATVDELNELIGLIEGMQPTIPSGGEFGLVYQRKFIAFFDAESFIPEGATFRTVPGLNLPGITDEPDPMRRLSNFWQLRRQGVVVDLWDPEVWNYWPRQFLCAGNGRSWVEYTQRRRGKAHPFFALDVPYFNYTFVPYAPVVTDRIQRMEL